MLEPNVLHVFLLAIWGYPRLFCNVVNVVYPFWKFNTHKSFKGFLDLGGNRFQKPLQAPPIQIATGGVLIDIDLSEIARLQEFNMKCQIHPASTSWYGICKYYPIVFPFSQLVQDSKFFHQRAVKEKSVDLQEIFLNTFGSHFPDHFNLFTPPPKKKNARNKALM